MKLNKLSKNLEENKLETNNLQKFILYIWV